MAYKWSVVLRGECIITAAAAGTERWHSLHTSLRAVVLYMTGRICASLSSPGKEGHHSYLQINYPWLFIQAKIGQERNCDSVRRVHRVKGNFLHCVYLFLSQHAVQSLVTLFEGDLWISLMIFYVLLINLTVKKKKKQPNESIMFTRFACVDNYIDACQKARTNTLNCKRKTFSAPSVIKSYA